MFAIKERENYILKEAMEAKKAGRKLFIYGAGNGGKYVYDALCEKGIMPDGFCVDAMYYKEGGSFCGLPIISKNSLGGGNGEPCTAIVAFWNRNAVGATIENVEIIDGDHCSLWLDARIEASFVDEHRDAFGKLYEELEDEKSRQCMESYLNQKISGKMKYLEPLWDQNAYYEKELVHIDNVSCIIDCGAYDGDSYCSFCENYKQNTGMDYVGQAYLLEPDEDNYRKLQERFSENSVVVALRLGAWHEKSVIRFVKDKEEMTLSGRGGRISEIGEMSIETDKIDNIVPLSTKVDFIKMDIEGSELNALKGAEKTIRKYHPILAICVYHKPEDLVTIPQYIKSLYSDYKLYLRTYSKFCQELVLYALPY